MRTIPICIALLFAAGCKDPRLHQVEDCAIEANHHTPELCNGKDDDCDNVVDEGCDDDDDGYCNASMTLEVGATCSKGGDDCDDSDPNIHPGVVEVCDNKDNDCNGQVDLADQGINDVRLGLACGQDVVPAAKVSVGICRLGTNACVGGSVTCIGAVAPSGEVCDSKDNDCNGLVDDGAHLFELCQSPDNTNLLGECRPGVYRCLNGQMDRVHCVGEVKPATEVCDSKDNDCSGSVDEGCAVTIVCPADTTVPVGTAATLTVSATAQSGTVTGYAWTVLSGPPGGIGTPNQWDPAPPIAVTEKFLPMIVGIYTIHVSVTASNGATASCNTRVTAISFGLHVELTWDGSADMDLHLHNGAIAPWFYSTGKSDCYYSEKTPDWGVASYPNDDPSLDVDNVMADGPENIRIAQPVTGETYTVGVQNYSRGNGRIATVRIFCGSSTVPTATYVSRAFTGTSGGQCTTNDFWKPASVVFTSPSSCTITYLDSWSTSGARCTSF